MLQNQYQPDLKSSHIFWLQREHFDFSGDSAWLERIQFSLRSVYDVVAGPGWTISAPLQPWNEIWLVKSGQVQIQLGEQCVVVGAGEIAILSAQKPRKTTEVAGKPLSIIGFSFDATLLEAFDVVSLLEPPIRLCADDMTRENVENVLQNAICESRTAQAGFSLLAQSWAQIAFIKTLRAALPSDEIEHRLQSKIRAAFAPEIATTLDFVAANFSETLELGMLARRANLSSQHFARKFKSATGLPPMEYVRQFRLAKAHSLLAGTDRSISDIALACGFPDAAYFSRAFKEYFAIAPLEFRKQTRAFSPKTG
ncbi:AraC family transcriptional regulator [bacterium]|nr:MAG: AraC family transcriptional regulator [bacterium]